MPINPLILPLTGVFLAAPYAAATPTLGERANWMRPFIAGDTTIPTAGPSAPALMPRTGWKSKLASNARDLSNLRDGWDGHGSIAVPASILSRAVFYTETALNLSTEENAFEVSMIAPHLVPGGDGSIQIEWHTKRGQLEFDIDSSGSMSIWIHDRLNMAEFDGEGDKALALFYRWAPWIASQERNVADVETTPQMAKFAIAS